MSCVNLSNQCHSLCLRLQALSSDASPGTEKREVDVIDISKDAIPEKHKHDCPVIMVTCLLLCFTRNADIPSSARVGPQDLEVRENWERTADSRMGG